MIDRFLNFPIGERILFILWGLWLILILIAAFRVLGFFIARRAQDRKLRKKPATHLPVALIVPVKGFDLQSTPRFFDALFAQEYPEYRVIVCFESWNDPVSTWLRDQFDLPEEPSTWHHPNPDSPLKSVTLVCAGTSKSEGQKVHNQRAAFGMLKDSDRIVAFADADIHCKRDWLDRLVAPINHGSHRLSTTYRWLVPKRPTLPNQLASVINGSITTQGGSELTNVLWGGSMAITHDLFLELDVPNLFKGSLNDDLRLSKAARKAGNKIAFVRSLIMPTMIDFDWKGFFEFTKRQYTQVKFFSPILYTGTNFVLGFYIIGAMSILTALIYGYFWAWIPIAVAYVIDQFRALARQQVYLSLFPENGIRSKLFAACWLEHMLTPIWMFLHWILLISTWTQNRIQWAGIDYRIHSKSKTEILHRPSVEERLPVGVPGLALLAEIHNQRRTGYTQPVQPRPTSVEPAPSAPAETQVSTEEPSEVVTTESIEPETPSTAIVEEESTPEEVLETVEAVEEVEEQIEEEIETTEVVYITHPGGQSAVIALSAAVSKIRKIKSESRPVRKFGQSRLDTHFTKSRVQKTTRHSVEGRMPSYSSPREVLAPVAPAPEKSVESPSPQEDFRPISRSVAAHRSGPGHVFRKGAASRNPARSSRPNAASKATKRARQSRNTSRGASARP